MFPNFMKRPIFCILPCLILSALYIICTFNWYNTSTYTGTNHGGFNSTILATEEIPTEDVTADVLVNNGTRAQMTTFVLNNPDLCKVTDPTTTNILIVVLSSRRNFDERKLIRETYGSIKTFNNVTVTALVFMLGHIGEPGENPDVSKRIDAEFDQYRDTVSGMFTDTYRNLTRKAIMAYEWISLHCSSADMIVKTDDDVIVNIFQLTYELQTQPPQSPNTFRCWIHNNEGMIRDTTGGYARYHVTYDQIPGTTFPRHCAGVGYIILKSLVPRLLTGMYEEEHMVTHEDVYITGILPPRVNNMINSSLLTPVINFMFKNSSTELPISLEDYSYRWYRYHPNNGVSDATLLKISKDRKWNEVNGEVIFDKAYGTVLFFLVEHSGQFQKEFLELWSRILINTFVTKRNSKGKNIIKQ